jgi:DEAD/DEAH box helicase domain-containing protein
MSELGDLGRAVGDGEARWFATAGAHGRGSLRQADGGDLDPESLERFVPTLFLYDNYPGGVGLAAPMFDQRGDLLSGARGLIAACDCACGCPACVGPILASETERGYSPKAVALQLLELLTDDP